MGITRRSFVRGSLLAGGSLLFSPVPLYAQAKKEEVWRPAYAQLEADGNFSPRIEQAYRIFEHCRLCPRQCGVNRKKQNGGVRSCLLTFLLRSSVDSP